MVFIRAGNFGDEVDAFVLGIEVELSGADLLRPIGEQPDIRVEVRVFRFVAEVGADQFLEVGALLPLGLGYAAVCGEDFLERGHRFM